MADAVDQREKILAELDELVLSQLDDPASARPDLALITELHPHQDAYVSFAVSSGEDFVPLVGLPSAEIRDRFARWRARLSKDSYVGINAAFRLAGYKRSGEGSPKHASDTLRYLCCCFIDIDHYKIAGAANHPGFVVAAVVYYEGQGVIPKPSITVISGRGIWLLFLLRDAKDPQRPQRAWPEKITLYRAIERALVERLSHLGADLAAVDPARYIRVPGSFHSGAEKTVTWLPNRGPEGAVPRYTLAELAEFLKLPSRRQPSERARYDSRINEPRRISKRRGWEALQQRRLRDFEKLRALRGGFYEGCRHHALLLYGWLLRCNGTSSSVASRQVTELAAECHPPLPFSAVRSAIKSAFGKKIRKICDQKISDWLLITAEESRQLEKLPPAFRHRMSVEQQPASIGSAKPSRRRAPEARRILVQQLLSELGRVPHTREMARLLAGQGCRASHVTVSADYNVLGIRQTNN